MKKSKVIDWYIKGEYHCDKCPFCWGGEYLPGCDDYEDAGCYIFGDLRDSCRLIPPVRFLLGWGKRKKAEYRNNHEYDDYPEWAEKQIKQNELFRLYLKEYILNQYAVFYKDHDGEVVGEPVDVQSFLESYDVLRLQGACEDLFSPPQDIIPLRKKWGNLIKETWHSFIGVFKPYFCK